MATTYLYRKAMGERLQAVLQQSHRNKNAKGDSILYMDWDNVSKHIPSLNVHSSTTNGTSGVVSIRGTKFPFASTRFYFSVGNDAFGGEFRVEPA